MTQKSNSIVCIIYGIIDCVIFFFLGLLSFNLVSDPLDSLAPWGPNWEINTTINQMFIPLLVYFAFMATYGIIQVALTKQIEKQNWIEIFILTCGPPILLVLMIGLYLLQIPLIRGILIIAPLIGDIRAFHLMARSCFPSQSLYIYTRLKWFERAELIFTITFSLLIELFLHNYRAIGAIIMYIGFISIGLVMLFESLWVYNVTAQSLSQINSGKTTKMEMEISTSVNGAALSIRAKDRSLWKTVVVFILVTTICVVLFKPSIDRYYIEPELTLQKAELTKKGIVNVIVINKAGSAVVGKIQLWLNNSTKLYLLGEINRLEGFGLWEVSKDIGGILVVDKKIGLNFSLTLNGMNIKSKHLYYPNLHVCMIPISFIALATCSMYSIRLKAHQKLE